jgi:hypothetical protein
MDEQDVEALARAETRERLSPWALLRLYLDPFALFKNVTVGTPASQESALQYNRRHRDMLLSYIRRWALIAVFCVVTMVPLAGLARAEPALCVPIVGLEIGFSTAVSMLLLSLAVYLILGLRD